MAQNCIEVIKMAYFFNDDKTKAEIKLYETTLAVYAIPIPAHSTILWSTPLNSIATWENRNKIIGVQSMDFPSGINCLSYRIDGNGGINYVFELENITDNTITLTPNNTNITIVYIE